MNSIKDGGKAVMSYFMVRGIYQDAERKTKKKNSVKTELNHGCPGL